MRDGRQGILAQLGVAGQLDDLPQLAHVEQAVDGEDLLVLHAEQARQRRAQLLGHACAGLHADDLPEAPAAQLVLDRLEQVGGVVGDLEVGVAGDAEDVAVGDLHAREQRVQVVGDHVLERHQQRPGARPGKGDEARQDLGRHLHAREHGLVGDRVADQHRQAQREVGDVGKRPAGGDRERRQRREDHLLEMPGQLGAVLFVELADADDLDVVVGQPGPQPPFEAVGQPPSLLEHPLADQLERLARRASVLARCLDARLDLVAQAGDAHHVVLVEVGRVDRAELDALEQGDVVVLRELQDAVVEVQPGELAVYVERGILELVAAPARRTARALTARPAPPAPRSRSDTRQRRPYDTHATR